MKSQTKCWVRCIQSGKRKWEKERVKYIHTSDKVVTRFLRESDTIKEFLQLT